MTPRFNTVVRDLHLYSGLFAAPFVLVFSVSVFLFVHAWTPGAVEDGGPGRAVSDLRLPANVERMEGRERIEALRGVLAGAGVVGEMGFIRHDVKARRLVVPVSQPGRETKVEIDLAAGSAVITRRETGALDALLALHKSPGPHLAAIRMNWLPMRVWFWLADTTVYLALFLSITGIYLWAMLRKERRIGLILMGAGALSFCGVVYALAG